MVVFKKQNLTDLGSAQRFLLYRKIEFINSQKSNEPSKYKIVSKVLVIYFLTSFSSINCARKKEPNM